MKRTRQLGKQTQATFERFEPRICMDGDMDVTSDAIEIFQPATIVDYADFLVFDEGQRTIDRPEELTGHDDLEQVLPGIGLTDELIDQSDDTRLDVELDFPIDIIAEVGVEEDVEHVNPEDILVSLPIASGPAAGSPTLPGTDQRRDPIPRRRKDPERDDTSDEVSNQEGSNGDSPNPLPEEPPDMQPGPSPQPAPPTQVTNPESTPRPSEQQPLPILLASPVVQGTNPVSRLTFVDTQSSNIHLNPTTNLPPVDKQMQRFSSTEIAFSIINRETTEMAFAGDAPAILPWANLKRSSASTPEYFVRRKDFRAPIHRDREIDSDPSIGHHTDEIDPVVSKEIARGTSAMTSYDGGALHRSSHYAAYMLVAYPHHAVTIPSTDPDTAIAPPNGGGLPAQGIPFGKRERELTEPTAHRFLQRFLGVMMAGALIAIQETSRILQNHYEKENALHLNRISALKNSSNS
jgi:hypothetical protein